ncbi:MAG: DUF1013 domain-containing protein [Holosporaceae bacterium]|jgi:hypothetical protein|nr:DUF1013 domain-containing protein [Holosporaceae bacterium]
MALIMPQGTAVWLIENTALTFNQIADFCGLHVLEVQALADGQVAVGMVGVDPVRMGQLTAEEIERCSKDPEATLVMSAPKFSMPKTKSKKKYTPLIKRQERPDAIAWLVKFYPEMSDAAICALVSTTKNTIVSIRNRTHARINEIRPKDPVLLGFCSQIELDSAIASLKKNSKTDKKDEDSNGENGEQAS